MGRAKEPNPLEGASEFARIFLPSRKDALAGNEPARVLVRQKQPQHARLLIESAEAVVLHFDRVQRLASLRVILRSPRKQLEVLRAAYKILGQLHLGLFDLGRLESADVKRQPSSVSYRAMEIQHASIKLVRSIQHLRDFSDLADAKHNHLWEQQIPPQFRDGKVHQVFLRYLVYVSMVYKVDLAAATVVALAVLVGLEHRSPAKLKAAQKTWGDRLQAARDEMRMAETDFSLWQPFTQALRPRIQPTNRRK